LPVLKHLMLAQVPVLPQLQCRKEQHEAAKT
jgi:hypothetical protein